MLYTFIAPKDQYNRSSFLVHNTEYNYYFRENTGTSQIRPSCIEVHLSSKGNLDTIAQELEERGVTRQDPNGVADIKSYLQK